MKDLVNEFSKDEKEDEKKDEIKNDDDLKNDVEEEKNENLKESDEERKDIESMFFIFSNEGIHIKRFDTKNYNSNFESGIFIP